MLVSAGNMLRAALAGGYAVGQFNVNSLGWAKAILLAAEEARAPVILGVTGAAAAQMTGLATVGAMIRAMVADMEIRVPVALHLDHASAEACQKALDLGFTSVMFDGSHMPFAENLKISRALAGSCKGAGASLETELGQPAGEEDGISGSGEKASPEECARMAETGIDCLAASIGNMHGQYPANWKGLDFGRLSAIRQATGGLPLALHGGSGIPDEMILKAISLGISKINVNTECQIAFCEALREYFAQGLDKKEKGYSAAKILGWGEKAIEKAVIAKMRFFGCAGKA